MQSVQPVQMRHEVDLQQRKLERKSEGLRLDKLKARLDAERLRTTTASADCLRRAPQHLTDVIL